MTDLVYSQTRQPDGRKQLNPRFFDGPVEGITTVYIDGDWPRIAEAYEAKGVKVLRIDAVAPAFNIEFRPLAETGPTQFPVFIPADWRELGWSQPDERGLTLRSLASQVSETAIINKAQAVAAIEAYLGVEVEGGE